MTGLKGVKPPAMRVAGRTCALLSQSTLIEARDALLKNPPLSEDPENPASPAQGASEKLKDAGIPPALLAILLDEIARVQQSMPKSWDEGARLLALARPIVEAAALSCGYAGVEDDLRPGPKPRRPPFSKLSLLEIEVFAHLWFFGSYRNTPKVLREHPAWIKALKVPRAPDHTTLSHFRAELGEEFFVSFFKRITNILVAFGLVAPDAQLLVDSAPVYASMNFARANALPTLDEAQVVPLFEQLDLAPALALLPNGGKPARKGKKRKYPVHALVGLFVLEWVGGFLSRSQVLKYLAKHEQVTAALGFDDGLPKDSSLTTFLKNAPLPAEFLRALRPQLVPLLQLEEVAQEEQDDPYFFLANCGKASPAPTLTPGLVIARQKSWHF
jgi:hypothetical protein